MKITSSFRWCAAQVIVAVVCPGLRTKSAKYCLAVQAGYAPVSRTRCHTLLASVAMFASPGLAAVCA